MTGRDVRKRVCMQAEAERDLEDAKARLAALENPAQQAAPAASKRASPTGSTDARSTKKRRTARKGGVPSASEDIADGVVDAPASTDSCSFKQTARRQKSACVVDSDSEEEDNTAAKGSNAPGTDSHSELQ